MIWKVIIVLSAFVVKYTNKGEIVSFDIYIYIYNHLKEKVEGSGKRKKYIHGREWQAAK